MMTIKPCEKDTEDDFLRCFNQMDVSSKGYIDMQDLRDIADELGEEISDQDIT
jgi:Ca2+-binding EF-hand superfamily protein